VVDDHPSSLKGIIAALKEVTHEGASQFEVVGYGTNGQEAIDLARKWKPDVMVMDIDMPTPGFPMTSHGMEGIEAARSILNQDSRVKIVILSMHELDRFIADAQKAGVSSYLPKDMPMERLVEEVQRVVRGRRGWFPSFRQLKWLTDYQREVLKWVAKGRSYEEIAEELDRSVRAVKAVMQRVMEKLGACNRTEAISRGFELGEVPPAVVRPNHNRDREGDERR